MRKENKTLTKYEKKVWMGRGGLGNDDDDKFEGKTHEEKKF